MKDLAEQFLKSKIGTNYSGYLFLSITELRVVEVTTNGHLIQIDFEYTEDWHEVRYDSRGFEQVSCWEILEFLFTEIQNK